MKPFRDVRLLLKQVFDEFMSRNYPTPGRGQARALPLGKGLWATLDAMKLLYSHRTASADGQYVHISEMVNALTDQGVDVTLCGPDGVSAPAEAPARKMDASARARKGLLASLPRPLMEVAEFIYSVPAFFRLSRAEKTARPDVLFERYNLYFLAGRWLARRRSLPLILEVNAPLVKERSAHGGLALPAFARWAEQRVWQSADAVLAVTHVLAEEIAAAGVKPEKIHVLANGVSKEWLEVQDGTPVREKYGLTDKFVLGFSGFVRDWHGVDQVLDYLSARRDPSLHFLLVGDGPHVPALEQKAKDLGLEDQFTVTGVIQRADMPAHVAAFDIALQPRVTAYASPLKLFEYMALGKPVIAPAQANIEEVLSDDENALLFDTAVPDAMVVALDRLVADSALRARLAAAARQTIIDRDLTWVGNAARVCALAQSLLDQ